MQLNSGFGYKELFTHLVGDMVKAVCTRGNESQQQKMDRSQAAVHQIMDLTPRDTTEAMFAGHCVMFHELLVDNFRLALMGESGTQRRATRTSIIAIDKAFRLNLEQLKTYQLRPAEGDRDEAGAPLTAAPEPAAGPLPATNEPASDPVAPPPIPADVPPAEAPAPLFAQSAAASGPLFAQSAAAVAACRINPEAMAALEAGDPVRFARAMGVAEPSEEFLAAANAPGSPFDIQRPYVPPAHHSGAVKADTDASG